MAFDVPNRPFASENFTGLALPGGFFVPMLGSQTINAHLTTDTLEAGAQVFVESVSDPNILVTPRTHTIALLPSGGHHLLQWLADFSRASPGMHRVSFIIQTAAGRTRIIKKIFVLGIVKDGASGAFMADFPEGRLEVRFREMLVSDKGCCGRQGRPDGIDLKDYPDFYSAVSDQLVKFFGERDQIPCSVLALLSQADISFVPNPPFSGQYGPLPFADPSVKEVLAAILGIFAAIALIVAFIVGVAASGAAVVVTGGASAVGIGVLTACCNPVQAVAVGIGIAAGVGAVLTALGDFPDEPFRRGQDNTAPPAGALTIAEQLSVALAYPEPIVPGTPYQVDAKWTYTREILDPATGVNSTLVYDVNERRTNEHLLSRYEIEHPDVVRVYRKEPFIVKARFFDENDELFRGNSLFVQCFLEGTGALEGRVHRFVLQDSGCRPDVEPSDGTYTGEFVFSGNDLGQWHVTVVAQDVNLARENMTPEEAATFLGSQVLTSQLKITLSGGTCPFTPDGDVRVI